jgi:Flp pilus assembly pilin Flp
MNFFNKKGFSVVEYAVLFVIIITAFLVMRNYIQRGIYGTWAKAGQTFAFGRQYDSQKSVECSFDEQSKLWYDQNCYESTYNQTCPVGGNVCSESVISSCQTSTCSSAGN